ncbi:SCO6880 family protein [Allobranchiibius huperziae]|uniref:Integral membrane protein n=1 Tax=Allobranchiibius huperziae TaxID=1874116 RepID=A0A853DQQ6_9MICO|nr:SCO6880 family protein [Allobranchiibius huperziae]NYJ76455.1 hypothetical protein [Allobranchiibius huperziae]
MSDITATEGLGPKRVTYGNLRQPKVPGLFGLPPVFLAGVGLAALVLIGVSISGHLLLGLGLILVTLAVSAVMLIPHPSGLNPYVRTARWARHRRAEKAGLTLLRQGPVGHAPDGKVRLPGLAAASELTKWHDSLGQPFGLITIPSTHHHTVVIECHAAGTGGVDQHVIDSQVAHWGAWLAGLGQTGDIVAAAAVIETAPDTGHRLRRAAFADLDVSSPAFSQQVLTDSVAGAAGSAVITTRLTVTFTGKPSIEGARGKAITTAQMAEEIGTRLPSLLDGLKATGAGTGCRPCTAQELVDTVRVAYDPSVAADVEEARTKDGTGLSWDQAGPMAAHAGYDHYEHESAVSCSWQMTAPPRGVFYDSTLAGLLAPHRDLTRKRVAILYRPQTPEQSAAAVDRDVKNTTWAASEGRRVTARKGSDAKAALKTEQEEAAGASLVRFGIVVTATVLDPELLPLARKTVASSLAAPARLRLRSAKGSQDVAFAASLPIGLVLPEHMTLPTSIREAM